jgi:exodeoxyribonuclease VII large subunit
MHRDPELWPRATSFNPDRWLDDDGAYDESAPGQWALTREGGHSIRRIIHAGVDATGAEVQRALVAGRRDIRRLIDNEADRIGHLSARLATLGPAATLARGYAVVQTVLKKEKATGPGSAAILRSTADAPAGTALRIRVADGAIGAVSTGVEDGAA